MAIQNNDTRQKLKCYSIPDYTKENSALPVAPLL